MLKRDNIHGKLFDALTEARPPADEQSAWEGYIQCFTQGEYWEAHEVLEHAWKKTTPERKQLYGGVILLAAALFKARTHGNPHAARRNFSKGLYKLADLPDVAYGLDLRELERRVWQALHDPSLQPEAPVLG